MAATGTKQQQPTATPVATVVDPKFEWAEKEGSYVLRLTLTGFRKDDFRVQVDSTGKLTVRGATRPGAGGPGSALYRVFQLPATASLEDIAGRFEAGVLTLTVPKRASSGASVAKEDGTPPTSIEEIRRKPAKEAAKPAPPAEVGGVEPKESVLSRTTWQVAERVQRMEEEANRRKQEEEKKPAPAAKKDQHPRPKAPQAAAAAAATPEKPAIGEKDKAAVDRESPEDRVRLCGDGEEVRAKAAATPTAMGAKAGHEKAAAATCTAWKERIVGELKGLTDMKWADNTLEIARKNKEVVAVGVAAFSLGFFVSQRLFGK
ncbi:inactive protein RESTRICTED TEV MOVEMENT 2-like [Triticum dicoccoides]|uniref:inactive protein RESTRICTED TEV MOVEMENT 2-like n=1 Tax=Triticum dicoccoides TaxID=85692 RepID=UPI00188DDE76|nr:inactive protein RESTRICTED TEV MOVEMENT 2-like [Triticum dicoccoides]